MFGIHDLITQEIVFSQAIWGYLVRATYHFYINTTTGQWSGNINATLTDKGNDIVASLLTIIHNGLNFAAQFALLLPADASVQYNSFPSANMLHIP